MKSYRIIKAILWLAIWILPASLAHGQSSVQNFRPVESQGEMPEYLKQCISSEKSESYSPFLSTMFKRGKIVYGTSMNQYIDHIADNLLMKQPELRQQVHFYILDVPEVNAYSLKNGVILINMGLLAQVMNEAELAFVIAHEIAHFSKHHASQDKEKSKDKDIISEYLQQHQHSREHESEADKVGLTQYFKDSPYSHEIIDGIFDVLLYSDLPFDEVPFNKSVVETDFYSFPDNYFLNTVANISDRSSMVDTFLTHPNISKRRAAAKALVRTFPNDQKKTFVQSEDLFHQMQDQARFSCVEYYLNQHQYDKAIYNIFLLQQLFPDNEYLEKSMVTAFYGASKHKNFGTSSSITQPYRKVEGEMQQVCYFLSKMNRLEYSLLALRKAWTAQQKHPEDPYLQAVVKDLIADIFVKQKKTYVDFCDYPQGTKSEDVQDEDTTSNAGNTKYDKIRQQSYNNKVLPDPKFKTANYMLVDFHQDPLFKDLVNDAVVNSSAYELLDNVSAKHIGDQKSLILADPVYRVYDNSSDLNLSLSKKYAGNLNKMMVKATKKMKITPVSYHEVDIKKMDTKQYNELVKMQRLYYDIQNAEGIEMRYHTTNYTQDLLSSYGPKMCFVNVVRHPYHWFSFDKFYMLVFSTACPYILPFTIANCCFMRYETNVYFNIMDLENGIIEVKKSFNQDSPMSRAYVDGFVYSELEKYIKGKK